MIYEALLKIQSELKAPKSQYNSFSKYNYRNCEDILEAVKPFLKETGTTLTLSDEIVEVGGRVYVKATAYFSAGEYPENKAVVVSAYAREPLDQKGMGDSQITGATSSYARKYALNGLFCIDDTKDQDSEDNTETVHRFKKGEQDEIIAQSLACLEMGDAHGLRQILAEYSEDPDVKTKVWMLFNSTQRASMKILLSGD